MNLILAVAIATIGAFHDMNYLDAKKELVEITGHPELVLDSAGGDFSDHTVPERPKAKTYLNKANRRIEDALVELKAEERFSVAVIEGQYKFSVPQLRYVSRIDMLDTENKIGRSLRRRTIGFLRDLYCRAFSLVTVGPPRDWCRCIEVLPSNPVNLFTNGDFTTTLAPWQNSFGTATVSSVVSGRARVQNNTAVASSAGIIYTFDTPVDVTGATLSVELANLGAGSQVYFRLYGPGDNISFWVLGSDDITDRLQANGTYTYDMDALIDSLVGRQHNTGGTLWTIGELYELKQSVVSFQMVVGAINVSPAPGPVYDACTVDFDNVELTVADHLAANEIVILPPADKPYTANVFGGYYAHAFEDDADETWASVNCSNALTLMAKAYVSLLVEGDSKTFKELETQALREASEVWANSIHEQIEGIPLEEQRFGPISFGPYAGNTGEAPMYQWDDA